MQTRVLEKNIEKEPIDKRVQFMRDLHAGNLEGNWSYFDKFESGLGRWVKDPEMDLETFIDAYSKTVRPFVKLIVGREERIPNTLDNTLCIQLYVGHVYPKGIGNPESVSRYFCPFNEESYERVNHIFMNNFGTNIDEYK
ncbi:MAG: hypothetical protein Q8N63_04230 [Nanoarchaeota archaeon]|nr:hypothetical protein [Nanoarchaeota archaeon]